VVSRTAYNTAPPSPPPSDPENPAPRVVARRCGECEATGVITWIRAFGQGPVKRECKDCKGLGCNISVQTRDGMVKVW